MLCVLGAWNTRTHRIIWNLRDADNLARVVNSEGNGFCTACGAKVGKGSVAIKKGVKSTLVRSKKFTHDLAPVVNIAGITFRGRLNVCHNAIAVYKRMSHAVVLAGAKTNNQSFIIYGA